MGSEPHETRIITSNSGQATHRTLETPHALVNIFLLKFMLLLLLLLLTTTHTKPAGGVNSGRLKRRLHGNINIMMNIRKTACEDS
jgi:hypothetical protein